MSRSPRDLLKISLDYRVPPATADLALQTILDIANDCERWSDVTEERVSNWVATVMCADGGYPREDAELLAAIVLDTTWTVFERMQKAAAR